MKLTRLFLLFLFLKTAGLNCYSQFDANDVVVNLGDDVTIKNDSQNPWQITTQSYLLGTPAIISPAPSSLSADSTITFSFKKHGNFQFLHRLNTNNSNASISIYRNDIPLQQSKSKWRIFHWVQPPNEDKGLELTIKPGNSDSRIIIDQCFLRSLEDYYIGNEFGGKINVSPSFSWDDILEPRTLNIATKKGFVFKHLNADVESLEVANRFFARERISITSERTSLDFLTSNGTYFDAFFDYPIRAFDNDFVSWGVRVWDIRDNKLSSPYIFRTTNNSRLETKIEGPATVEFSFIHVETNRFDQSVDSSSEIEVYLDGTISRRHSITSEPELQRILIPEGIHTLGFSSSAICGQPGPGLDSITYRHAELEYFRIVPGISISIKESERGSVSITPSKLAYAYGDAVTVTAIPNPGYRFDRWHSDRYPQKASLNLRLVDNIELEPTFAPLATDPNYEYHTSGDGYWSQTSDTPLSIKSPNLASHESGSLVFNIPGPGTFYFEVDAFPSAQINGPEVDILLNGEVYFGENNSSKAGLNVMDLPSGMNTIIFHAKHVGLNSYRSEFGSYRYTPFVFKNLKLRPQYLLETRSLGPGTITTSPTGSFFDIGQPVSLNAIPNDGAVFSHWNGSDSSDSEIEVQMNSSKTIEAVFADIVDTQLSWRDFTFETSPDPKPYVSEYGGLDGNILQLEASTETANCFATLSVNGPAVLSGYFKFGGHSKNDYEVLLNDKLVPLKAIGNNWDIRHIRIPTGNHTVTFKTLGGLEFRDSNFLAIDQLRITQGYQVLSSIDGGTFDMAPLAEAYQIGEQIQVTAYSPDPESAFLGWSGSVESDSESISINVSDHTFIQSAFGQEVIWDESIWQYSNNSAITIEDDALLYRPNETDNWLKTNFSGPGILTFEIFGDGYSPEFSHSPSGDGHLHYTENRWNSVRIEIDEEFPAIRIALYPFQSRSPEKRLLKLRNWRFEPGLGLETNGVGSTIQNSNESDSYSIGDQVTLTATALDGNRFSHWLVNGKRIDNSNTKQLSLDRNTRATAVATLKTIDFASSFSTKSPSTWRWTNLGSERALTCSSTYTLEPKEPLELQLLGPGRLKFWVSEHTHSTLVHLNREAVFSRYFGNGNRDFVEILLPPGEQTVSIHPGGYDNIVEIISPEFESGEFFSIELSKDLLDHPGEEPIAYSSLTSSILRPGTQVSYEAKSIEGFRFSHWLVNGEKDERNPIDLVLYKDIILNPIYTKQFEGDWLEVIPPNSGYSKTFSSSGWLSFDWRASSGFGAYELRANGESLFNRRVYDQWRSESIFVNATPNEPVNIEWRGTGIELRNIVLDTNISLKIEATNGTVEIEGEKSRYTDTDVVKLTAIPDSGFLFGGWDGTFISQENPIELRPSEWKLVRPIFYQEVEQFGFTWRISGKNSTPNFYQYPGNDYSFGNISNIAGGETVRLGVELEGPGIVSYWFEAGDHAEHRVILNGETLIEVERNTDVFHLLDEGPNLLELEAKNVDGRESDMEKIAFHNLFFESGWKIKVATQGNYTSINPLKDTYNLGDQITITAIPANGATFSHWSGDLSGSDDEITTTINGHLLAEAHYDADLTFEGFAWEISKSSSIIIEAPSDGTHLSLNSSLPGSFTLDGAGTLVFEWSTSNLETPLRLVENGNTQASYQNLSNTPYQFEKVSIHLEEDKQYKFLIDGQNYHIRKMSFSPDHETHEFIEWLAKRDLLQVAEKFNGLSLISDYDGDGLPLVYERIYATNPSSASSSEPFRIIKSDDQYFVEVSINPELYSLAGNLLFSTKLQIWIKFEPSLFEPFIIDQSDDRITFLIPFDTLAEDNALFFQF